jgi:hypothetical protein
MLWCSKPFNLTRRVLQLNRSNELFVQYDDGDKGALSRDDFYDCLKAMKQETMFAAMLESKAHKEAEEVRLAAEAAAAEQVRLAALAAEEKEKQEAAADEARLAQMGGKVIRPVHVICDSVYTPNRGHGNDFTAQG